MRGQEEKLRLQTGKETPCRLGGPGLLKEPKAKTCGGHKISKVFMETYIVLPNILICYQSLSLFIVCVSAKSQLIHLHVSKGSNYKPRAFASFGLTKGALDTESAYEIRTGTVNLTFWKFIPYWLFMLC